MRLLNPLKNGVSPRALEELYNLVVIKNGVQEAKLDRIKKELSVAACAIEDGVITDLETAKTGMLNLIAYIEAKTNLDDELDAENGSIDLINKHLEAVKNARKPT